MIIISNRKKIEKTKNGSVRDRRKENESEKKNR